MLCLSQFLCRVFDIWAQLSGLERGKNRKCAETIDAQHGEKVEDKNQKDYDISHSTQSFDETHHYHLKLLDPSYKF
jgi:hypothetical protein